LTLQNPILGILVVEGVRSLDGEQGSGPLKPRYEVSCQGLHGTEVVMIVSLMIPSGHWAAPRCINAFFHSYGALQVVSCEWKWNTVNKREMVEANELSDIEPPSES
jgi:hypothetical protein